MDDQSAKNLLNKTFRNEFDMGRFSNFIKDLFNDFRLNSKDQINYVPKEYMDYITSFNSLGTYKDDSRNSIEVFVVGLKRNSSRDRARTMQRNLIAKFLEDRCNDAALVAFHGDDPEDWRFSFVKLELGLIKNSDGKPEEKKKLTPVKRYSYLVGINEPNHTCMDQFLDLIKEEEIKPSLGEIESAFSVEKVTKDFFTEYRKLFLDLKQSLEKVIEQDEVIKKEFEEKNVQTVDFAKKLLGQIVFIYFLQKKGWLGVKRNGSWGEGPKNFLRKLFDDKKGHNNFFNEIIEPLFYEALATERDEDYYSRFECKIPFLNGGLFEPINEYDWVGTDITLGNDVFENIFCVFDKFNFTVKEDEPLEKEVAVDPEMLGKVFENLLEVTDRKSKGAFYTPREIVHYMCQQSLINYLETNSNVPLEDLEKFIKKGEFALDSIIKEQEQLKKYNRSYEKQALPDSINENSDILDKLLRGIKVVDPAVGSGAFPVGMMNEIVRARSILSLLSGNGISNYDIKRETIENSLYGVDIDSSAVDITKLRFWLSLIVDEDEIGNIKPLPNLDHKIMCGNSLLEEFEGMKLFDEKLLEEIPEFTDKQSTLDENFNIRVQNSQLKLKELKKLQKLFFNEQGKKKKKEYRKKIDKIEWELIEETLKEDGNEEAIEKLEGYKRNQSKPFFLWKLYFSEVFQRENPGFDVVIANPPYVFGGNEGISNEEKAIFKKKYRSGTKKINLFTLFIEQGTYLLRRSGFLVYITPNTLLRVTSYSNIREFIVKNKKINEIMDLDVGVFENVTASIIIISIVNEQTNLQNPVLIKKNLINTCYNKFIQKDFVNKNFILNIFCMPEERRIIKKMREGSIKLGTLSKIIRFGIVITKNKDEVVGYNKLNNEWKPFLEGNEIGRYSINYNGRYLYYKKELLHRSRTPEIFESNKILIQRITGGKMPIKATYDTLSYYTKESIINLILSTEEFSHEYVLSLLNSKLINWFYTKEYSNESKLTVNLSKEYLSEIPIKIISLERQKLFINLVDQIFDKTKSKNYLKNSKKRFEVQELEKKIDLLVYDIYDLTNEEIEIIEKGFDSIL